MVIFVFGEKFESFDSVFLSSTLTVYWFRVYGFTVKLNCTQLATEKEFRVIIYRGISDTDKYLLVASAQKVTIADSEDFIQTMISYYTKK